MLAQLGMAPVDGPEEVVEDRELVEVRRQLYINETLAMLRSLPSSSGQGPYGLRAWRRGR